MGVASGPFIPSMRGGLTLTSFAERRDLLQRSSRPLTALRFDFVGRRVTVCEKGGYFAGSWELAVARGVGGDAADLMVAFMSCDYLFSFPRRPPSSFMC